MKFILIVKLYFYCKVVVVIVWLLDLPLSM